MAALRVRRSPQRGQVVALQRPRRRRRPRCALRLATTEPNVGVAKVPDARLTSWPTCLASRNVVPAAVQFLDIGGLVEGASKGRVWATASSPTYERLMPSCLSFAPSSTPMCPARPSRWSISASSSWSWSWPISRPPSRRSTSGARRPRQDRSIADEVAALERAIGLLERVLRSTGRGSSSANRQLLSLPTSCCPTRPVMALVDVDEQQLADVDSVLGPVRAESTDQAKASAMCVQLEAEAALFDADRRAEMLEGLGLGEGALPAVRAPRLPPSRLAHVLHHGRQGEPGLDLPGRVAGSSLRACKHTDFERGYAPEVIHWDDLGGESAHGTRPRRSASCGSRARTMRSPMATSSRSASTSEVQCDGSVLR